MQSSNELWQLMRRQCGSAFGQILSTRKAAFNLAKQSGMRRRGVPTEQISHYLGHLPRGGAKTTAIYAPMEAQDCKEAAAAIEAVMSEIRGQLKIADLDDPNALFAEDTNGRTRDGYLGDARRKELERLIEAGTGITEICRRVGVSNTLVYRYRKRILDVPGFEQPACRCVPLFRLAHKKAGKSSLILVGSARDLPHDIRLSCCLKPPSAGSVPDTCRAKPLTLFSAKKAGKYWWARQDSNLRPNRYERSALTN